MYSINSTVKNKKFCLSLHYNGENSDDDWQDGERASVPMCKRFISQNS